MRADRYNDLFPARLRELMEGQGVTQQVVADAAGVRRQTIAAYADGSADPTLPKLVAMAEFFGVSLDFLAGKEPAKAPENAEIMKRLGLSEDAIQELETYQRWHFNAFTGRVPLMISALLTAKEGVELLHAMCKYAFAGADYVYQSFSDYGDIQDIEKAEAAGDIEYAEELRKCGCMNRRMKEVWVVSKGASLGVEREQVYNAERECLGTPSQSTTLSAIRVEDIVAALMLTIPGKLEKFRAEIQSRAAKMEGHTDVN